MKNRKHHITFRIDDEALRALKTTRKYFNLDGKFSDSDALHKMIEQWAHLMQDYLDYDKAFPIYDGANYYDAVMSARAYYWKRPASEKGENVIIYYDDILNCFAFCPEKECSESFVPAHNIVAQYCYWRDDTVGKRWTCEEKYYNYFEWVDQQAEI
jgi:hypothetical protein